MSSRMRGSASWLWISWATFGPMPGVSAICSGVAASRASTVRKRWATLRPVTKPTPSMPIANSTRPNGVSLDFVIASSARRAEISPQPSSDVSCSSLNR